MRRLVPLVFIVVVGCSFAPERVAMHVRAIPVPTPFATITLETPVPTHAPVLETPRPSPRAVPAPRRDPMAPFRGLGSWSDVYDYNNNPASIVPLVRVMAAHGVRTLYIETSRHSDRGDIAYPRALGAAIDAAKSFGMRVVGWYPPDFTNLRFDLRRTAAALRFRSPGGHGIDAFGADIEDASVKNPAERNRLVGLYSRELRRMAGTLPLAAVVYPPTQLQRRPDIWPGYPWRTFGAYYDIVMVMHYWTFHTSDPNEVFRSTLRNAALVRALTGRPAHVIGGLAGDANVAEVAAYVSAATEGGSVGGSLYDGRTTSAAEWVALATLTR